MGIKELRQLFEERSFKNILFQEPMGNHTTFKIGGPSDIMIIVESEEELIESGSPFH